MERVSQLPGPPKDPDSFVLPLTQKQRGTKAEKRNRSFGGPVPNLTPTGLFLASLLFGGGQLEHHLITNKRVPLPRNPLRPGCSQHNEVAGSFFLSFVSLVFLFFTWYRNGGSPAQWLLEGNGWYMNRSAASHDKSIPDELQIYIDPR